MAVAVVVTVAVVAVVTVVAVAVTVDVVAQETENRDCENTHFSSDSPVLVH